MRARAVFLGRIAETLALRGNFDEALRIILEEQRPIVEQLQDAEGLMFVRYKTAQLRLRKGILDETAARAVFDDFAASFEMALRGRQANSIVHFGAEFGQFLASVGDNDRALTVLNTALAAARRMGNAQIVLSIESLISQVADRG